MTTRASHRRLSAFSCAQWWPAVTPYPVTGAVTGSTKVS
jgi:hypothetical protein